MIEASRCHFCYDAPCIQACPTAIDIPGFIKTLGGYLLSHLGRMPYVGETFDVDDLAVEVLEVERRRITKVRARRREAEHEKVRVETR